MVTAADSGPSLRPGRARRKLGELFGVDPRGLAAFRVALALLLLADLANRARDLSAHYTDAGVLPRDALVQKFAHAWHVSIHLMSGSASVQAALFVLAAGFAVALLVGWRTRVATVASWALLVSLHGRNPMVLQGGDVLLRMLLFWSLFLPLGSCFSLDRLRGRAAHPLDRPVLSVASAALLLQVALVYAFGVALKTDPVWREQGTAVHYALSVDQFTTDLGRLLLGHPKLMRLLSFGTFHLEAWGPWLAFVPVLTAPLRTTVVLLFVGLHAGFGLCMELGLFPLISMAGWIPFLPREFWDGVERRLRRAPRAARPEVASSGPAVARIAGGALAGFFLAYVVLWNLEGLDTVRRGEVLPSRFAWVGHLLRIDQRWDMFAPSPLTDDGWYVVPGRLADGSRVDVLRGGRPLSWNKPESVSATYPNQRWRKYMMNLWLSWNQQHRPYYAEWLCRSWNQGRPRRQRLQSLDVYFMREDTLPDLLEASARQVHLVRQRCRDPRLARRR